MRPEVGFDTIGNATLIAYDGKPVLVTDPWIQGSAYFGSWMLSHEIPKELFSAATECPFVWFSHGHPDHLNPESLPLFKGKQILVPDHYGGRIEKALAQDGYRVRVLKDRKWYRLSDRIQVLCLADPLQDAILLVDIAGKLVININDTSHGGWTRFVRRTAKRFRTSFLLSLCCYGDVDMINFLDESGKSIAPDAAQKSPLGVKIAQASEFFGATHFIPFSSMHRYQRADSVWVNRYGTTVDDFAEGFRSDRCRLLPAFTSYDCGNDTHAKIASRENAVVPRPPAEFGDDWNEKLDGKDVEAATRYFQAVEQLRSSLDFVRLRVGGKETVIELAGSGAKRGITFEAPRGSLMTSIREEIFDDMLIGNFMKTTLHGDWDGTLLYPHLTPYLTKYADNGRAKTRDEVAAYLRAYDGRSVDERLYRFETRMKDMARPLLGRNTGMFRIAKRVYWGLRRLTG